MSLDRHCTAEELTSGSLSDEVRQHLESCPSCRERALSLWNAATMDHEGAARPGGTAPLHRATEEDAAPRGNTWFSASEEALPAPTHVPHHVDAAPPSHAYEPGDQADHFRILRLLGRGGMGEVFLARDEKLGRKVALKVLRPETLGSAQTAARFKFEARTTARFNHPHIVVIYAVGEHRGRPYVALEYLEGQTLRLRMKEERLGVSDIVRVGIAIVEALQEAHRNHILHRDLKPENVMIPRDGRIRVVDFGLAKAFAASPELRQGLTDAAGDGEDEEQAFVSHAGGFHGTPAYMAPEQWTGEECSASTDVWAFGMLLHELLSGRHPFAGMLPFEMARRVTTQPIPPVRAEGVPSALGQLVLRCLEQDSERRPSVATLLEELQQLAASGRPRRLGGQPPFRGLMACDENDAYRFVGRDGEIGSFLERLREEPVLPVIGPSGAGKSSFVMAGVVPRLREQGRWVVLRMRPGRSPMRSLASCLSGPATREPRVELGKEGSSSSAERPAERVAPGASPRQLYLDEEQLAEDLSGSPARLALRMLQMAERLQARVLLFVDQLEELYTLVPDKRLRSTFMEALCLAADDPHSPVRVIFTLRDDFLVRLAEGPAAREALGKAVVLRSPGPDDLREILTLPVTLAGYSYDDPDLVDEMVAAVLHEQAALPMLQVAGQMLWDSRDGRQRKLLRSAYDEMGGVAGALAHHASGVLQGLNAHQERLAREILLRLVTPEGTRRVLSHAHLLEGLEFSAKEVLDRLIGGRLVIARQVRGSLVTRSEAGVTLDTSALSLRNAETELVHESLIRNWDRLRRWLDESRDEVSFLEETQQAAELWIRRGRRDSEVWRGDALRDALRRAERVVALPRGVRDFLAAGQHLETGRIRRRRGLLAGGFSAVLLVAFVLAMQNLQTRRARVHAEQGRAEALREGADSAAARGNLLEARAKLRSAMEAQDSTQGRILWWKTQREPLEWRKGIGLIPEDVAFSPDGATLAVARQDGVVQLYDTRTRVSRSLRGHSNGLWVLAFSHDGRWLASGTHLGQIGLWDLERGDGRIFDAHSRAVSGLAFHPDGRRLVSASIDGSVKLWDSSSGVLRQDLMDDVGYLRAMALSPDGGLLALGGKQRVVRLWDLVAGKELPALEGHEGMLHSLAFSSDGRQLASAGRDLAIRLWDPRKGKEQAVLRGHTDFINSVAFHPRGDLLASGGRDSVVKLWDPETGNLARELRGHDSWIWKVEFSPDGKHLASAGQDNELRLWDMDSTAAPQPRGHLSPGVGLAFGPDGTQLVSSGFDKLVRLWDVATGDQLATLDGAEAQLHRVRFSPDGQQVAAASLDHSVQRWDIRTGAMIQPLVGHGGVVFDLRYSPDGALLASCDWQGATFLWDAASGEALHQLPMQGRGAYAVEFAPDGRDLLTVPKDADIRIWKVPKGSSSRATLAQRLKGAEARTAAFGPQGRWLVSGSEQGELRLWDLRDGAGHSLAELEGHSIWSVAFHSDGARIGVAASGGRAAIFDLEGRQLAELRGHRGDVNDIVFSPDGFLVATISDDATVRLWHAEGGLPFWRAPIMLGSPPEVLTQRGWISPGDAPSAVDESSWADVVETSCLLADESPSTDLLCLYTLDGELQLWARSSDQLLVEQAVQDPQRLLAAAGSCLVLDGAGQVQRFDASGGSDTLAREASALARDGQAFLVALGDRVARLDERGVESDAWSIGTGVSAMARSHPYLVLGYSDGDIELVSLEPGGSAPEFDFENLPPHRVVRLLPGPSKTLVAGFADGTLGLWNLENGVRLQRVKLHGSIAHLRFDGGQLYAATELGDVQRLDFTVLQQPYCDVLHDLWAGIPVVWEEGLPVSREPDADHPCFE